MVRIRRRDQEQPAAAPEDLPVPWVERQGQSPIVGSVDLSLADKPLWLSTNTGLWRVAADAGNFLAARPL